MREVRMVRAENIRPRTKVLGAQGRISVVFNAAKHVEDGSVDLSFVCCIPADGPVITHDCLAFEDELAVLV